MRPWLGASTQTVSADIASALKLDRPAGALIEDLWKDGPADKAGLEAGDVIIEIDGAPVYDAQTLRYRIGVLSDGDQASVAYIRNGKKRTGVIGLSLLPDNPAPDPRKLSGVHPLNGVTVANLSPRYNDELGIDPLITGVAVTEITRRTFAARRGLRRGYRILSVNGKKISSAKDLERALAKPSNGWTIEVDTGDRVVPWRVDGRR